MKPHAAHRGRAPEVDEGDTRDLVALLRRELRPTPGRLGDCLRIVVVLLGLIAIAETFRLSEIALSAYIVLFLSGREAASTVLTALLAGIAVVLAIFATIAVFMFSLSEPALRGSADSGDDLRRDVSLAGRDARTGVLRRRLHRRIRADLGRSGARPR